MPIITITDGIQTNNKYIPSGTSPIKHPILVYAIKELKKRLLLLRIA